LACRQQEQEITAEINHCQSWRDRWELSDYNNTQHTSLRCTFVRHTAIKPLHQPRRSARTTACVFTDG